MNIIDEQAWLKFVKINNLSEEELKTHELRQELTKTFSHAVCLFNVSLLMFGKTLLSEIKSWFKL